MAGQFQDTPNYWIDEEEVTAEQTEQALAVVEEENIPLPTITEQKNILEVSSVDEDGKKMLGSLIEMNNIAKTLAELRNDETKEMRRTVIESWCEAFIQARVKNNLAAEGLKQQLLMRLANNIENLDLATAAQIYVDLQQTTAVDTQSSMAMINGGAMPGMPGNNGTTVNLNLATAEGASVVNNTLNANPQQVGQLKEVAAMNNSIKAWSNVPLPKKKVVETEYAEK